MRNPLLVLLYGFLSCSTLSCKKQVHERVTVLTSLIAIEDSPGSPACPAGGIIIKTGVDRNQNNILDSLEVDTTKYVCNGENGHEGPMGQDGQDGLDGNTDKQIRLKLEFGGNTTSATPVIGVALIKFSKKNYVGVDSIILVANPYVADQTNTAIVELYNITDNEPVSNSMLTSNNLYSDTGYWQTGNIYNGLPDKEITLGLSMRSANQGMFAASGLCYLLLYRR